MERAAQEDTRLDSVHGGATDRAGLCRVYASGDAARPEEEGRAELSGHLHQRAALRPGDLCEDAECADEEASVSVHAESGVSGMPRQAPAKRVAVSYVRRSRYCGDVSAPAQAAGAGTQFLHKGGRRSKDAKGSPREDRGDPSDHRGSLRPLKDPVRSGVGLFESGAEHTDAFSGRTATSQTGYPGALQSVWRCLCTG